MPIDYKKIMAYRIPDEEMVFSKRDTMLYAVGIGLGADPVDEAQLRFCYEKDLVALPTMATVLAAPHAWVRKADVGSSGQGVHAGMRINLSGPLPVEGHLVSKNKLVKVVDKGPGKAAIVVVDREVFDKATGKTVFTLTTTSMQRGDGGFGGSDEETPVQELPDTRPDLSMEMPTFPNSALIYRLSGDYNPLHADPGHAKRVGFPRPILHGLCTYGVTGHALIKGLCGYDPARLTMMEGRFSKPVYPGETLRVDMWRRGNDVLFRTVVPARNDEIVFNNGRATIA